MPDKQIFFDPQRKRWKRLRRIFDVTAVVFTLVLVGFIFNVLRGQQLPELLLPSLKHNYKALSDRPLVQHGAKPARPASMMQPKRIAHARFLRMMPLLAEKRVKGMVQTALAAVYSFVLAGTGPFSFDGRHCPSVPSNW